jgi:hypothetical protein
VGAADHLRSWCRENPFLSGIHWSNAIEVGRGRSAPHAACATQIHPPGITT